MEYNSKLLKLEYYWIIVDQSDDRP